MKPLACFLRSIPLSAVVLFASSAVLAQPDDDGAGDDSPADAPSPDSEDEPADDAPPEAEASVSASVRAEVPAAPKKAAAEGAPEMFEVAPGAMRCREDAGHVGDHPGYWDESCNHGRLSWPGGALHGSFEVDVGYARYKFPDSEAYPYATLHDLRGRLTFGPDFRHELGSSGWFLGVRGTLVGWVREQENIYQINVDEAFVQVGKSKLFDFQLGRFQTWRVYHKGLGFDLYTLEDTGAPVDPNISNNSYFPHTYEVDYIYLQNSPYVNEVAGRAALHFYPARFLGFELAGAYGLAASRGANTIGGRFAGDFHWKYLRASVGAEYRFQKPTQPIIVGPGTDDEIECRDCGVSDNKGVGGSLVAKYVFIEAGGGAAKGWDIGHQSVGAPDGGSQRNPATTSERTSYGGYLQLDPGVLTFKRSLILGAGYQHTERLIENKDQFYHTQTAAYIAFPLGFNDAMLKFVLSQAKGEWFQATNVEGSQFTRFERTMTAGRLRFSTRF